MTQADGSERTARDEQRLVRMLHAQRRLDEARARLPHGSEPWELATRRLDKLNDHLMHLASTGTLPLEPMGNGLDLDLDTRPEEDLPFRGTVLQSVRAVLQAAPMGRAAEQSRGRLAAGRRLARSAMGQLERAQDNLRRQYPDAVLDLELGEDGTLSVTADRDGLSA